MRNSARAAELLQQSVDYLKREGLRGFSLAALAEDLGTSSRMLIYHLGPRDELLASVQAAMRRELVNEWSTSRLSRLSVALKQTWDHYRNRVQHAQIFFHLVARSFDDPVTFTEASAATVSFWLDFFEDVALREGYPVGESRIMARTTLGMFRGLVLDLSMTRDEEQTSLAIARCVDMLDCVSPTTKLARSQGPV